MMHLPCPLAPPVDPFVYFGTISGLKLRSVEHPVGDHTPTSASVSARSTGCDAAIRPILRERVFTAGLPRGGPRDPNNHQAPVRTWANLSRSSRASWNARTTSSLVAKSLTAIMRRRMRGCSHRVRPAHREEFKRERSFIDGYLEHQAGRGRWLN